MKHLFIFFLLIASITSFGQTKGTLKLYGYKQGVTPGVSPNAPAELGGGDEIKVEKKKQYNYLFYIVSTATVYPVEMWIEGKQYSSTIHKVKGPVEFKRDPVINSKPVVLVPKTTSLITQLIPAPAITGKGISKAKSLSKDNDFVVVYKMNGKTYYQAIKKLSPLESVILQ